MDRVDYAILRELGAGQVLLWGGSDPRVSAGDLARRLGVDRSTVRLRMRAWERSGFLRGFEALPNPTLLGVGLAAGGVRVEEVSQKESLLNDIALVDGMLTAMDHVGPWVGFSCVDDGPAAMDRRLRLLSRLPGVVEIQRPHTWQPPPCSAVPSKLDWRILRTLRRASKAGAERPTLRKMAVEVGVSVNTFHSHYDELVRGGAVWSIPSLDFSRYTSAVLARVILVLEPAASRRDAIGKATESVGDPIVQSEPARRAGEPQILSLIFQLPSVVAAEDAEIALRKIPGVVEVEVLFPRSHRVLGAWVDERIEGKA